MYTIGRLARRFGLSRSTLLYYDSIGLLVPSDRSTSGYREYSSADADRLKQICDLRKTGLSLSEISKYLATTKSEPHEILEARLRNVNLEMRDLRSQQALIVGLLKNSDFHRQTRLMSKKLWSDMLRSAGLDDDGMRRWHQAFERQSPEGHQDFLESLRLPPEEIQKIRAWSDALSKTGY